MLGNEVAGVVEETGEGVTRTYRLEQAGEVLGEVEDGHARGKVLIELGAAT